MCICVCVRVINRKALTFLKLKRGICKVLHPKATGTVASIR